MAFSPGIQFGQGVLDSFTGVVAEGGAAAGNEVVNTAVSAAAGSAMNIAFLSSVGALGGIGVPMVVLGGMMAKNIANGAADRMWSHVSTAGVGARRFVNLAAASMDEAGNLDFSRLQELDDDEFKAAVGERTLERTTLKESVLSRIERVNYCIRRRVFGQSKDSLSAARPTYDRLKARHKQNNEIVMQNRITGMASAQKLVTALGQRGAEGAFKSLQAFMESEGFQQATKRYMGITSAGIAQGVLEEVQTPEATKGLNHVGEHVVKGATKGALEQINDAPEVASKAFGELAKGGIKGGAEELLALEVPCGPNKAHNQSGKTKALPAMTDSGLNGAIKHAVDAASSIGTLVGAVATGGSLWAYGWDSPVTKFWAGVTGVAGTLFAFQGVDILERQNSGDAPPYVIGKQFLPYLTPLPEMALNQMKKIPGKTKKATSLGVTGASLGAMAGNAMGNMIGAINAGPLGRIAGETIGAIAGASMGGVAGGLFGSRYFTEEQKPEAQV